MMDSSTQNKPEILPTHTPDLFQEAVRKVVEHLARGEVVALPTETVYGLAAKACDARAIRQIFEVKGRPTINPLIVHVDGLEMARGLVRDWPDLARDLATAFWPGPLTMILPKADCVPDEVTAGGDTVGIRWPSHPFMRAVIKACGFPLAAPSANMSNQVSPTSPGHVIKSLGDRIPLVVDGGVCQVGIESTVFDLTVDPPAILRPGMIHEESLLAVCRELKVGSGKSPSRHLRSPGQLSKHYAPKARLLVLRWGDEKDLLQQAQELNIDPGAAHVIAHTQIPLGGAFGRISVIPHDPEAYARAIYGELHNCDQAEAQWILVERVPEGPEWTAVADRMQRAASKDGSA